MSSRVPQEANMCHIKYTNIVRQSGFAGCVKGLEWEGCNLGGEARLQKLRGRVWAACLHSWWEPARSPSIIAETIPPASKDALAEWRLTLKLKKKIFDVFEAIRHLSAICYSRHLTLWAQTWLNIVCILFLGFDQINSICLIIIKANRRNDDVIKWSGEFSDLSSLSDYIIRWRSEEVFYFPADINLLQIDNIWMG